MAQISISELSQTISELIDLDPEQQSSILTAIDRALDARQVVGGKSSQIRDIGGGSGIPSESQPTHGVPILINGIIAVPHRPHPINFPIGRIALPRHPRRGKHC